MFLVSVCSVRWKQEGILCRRERERQRDKERKDKTRERKNVPYLDLLVVGSFITITSVISPNLLKYSRSPSFVLFSSGKREIEEKREREGKREIRVTLHFQNHEIRANGKRERERERENKRRRK